MTTPARLDDLISYVNAQDPDGDPLAHLAAAVEVSMQLGELADHLIGHFVDQARRSGATWTDIGQHMGVSKQAAQQRFVPRIDDDDPDFPTGGRLSRFTQRARNVLVVARKEAGEHGQDQVLNEHVILGLLAEPDGLAAKAMLACDVSLDQVRGAVVAVLPARRKKSRRRPNFSAGTKKTLELALRTALRLQHNYIGTEHLLIGLLANDREQAARLLTGLGVTAERVEEWITAELAAIQAAKLG